MFVMPPTLHWRTALDGITNYRIEPHPTWSEHINLEPTRLVGQLGSGVRVSVSFQTLPASYLNRFKSCRVDKRTCKTHKQMFSLHHRCAVVNSSRLIAGASATVFFSSLLFHAGQAAIKIKMPSAEASKRAQCMSPGQYAPYIKGT